MHCHISSLGHAQGVVILMPQLGLWYIRKQGLKSECFSHMEFAQERKTIEGLRLVHGKIRDVLAVSDD